MTHPDPLARKESRRQTTSLGPSHNCLGTPGSLGPSKSLRFHYPLQYPVYRQRLPVHPALPFELPQGPCSRRAGHHMLHFTDKKTEAQKAATSLKHTQPVSGRAGLRIRDPTHTLHPLPVAIDTKEKPKPQSCSPGFHLQPKGGGHTQCDPRGRSQTLIWCPLRPTCPSQHLINVSSLTCL